MEHIHEQETLAPLFDNRDWVIAERHLIKFLLQIKNSKSHFIIIDRFHLSHAFRTSGSLNEFRNIEDELANAVIVLLTMEESVIQERIEETTKLRGASWAKGKKGTIEERTAYYLGQQQKLKGLAKESRIPVIEIDTTDKDWGRCLQDILRSCQL